MAISGFSCPLCSAADGERVAAYKGRSPTFQGRDIVRCRACGFVSAHPMPSDEELAAFYGSYWAVHEQGQPDMALYEVQAGARFRFLEGFLPRPGNGSLAVVDLGAGYGSIRKVLAEAYPGPALRYDAVEVDPDAVRHLRQEVHADHVYAELAESDCQYDVAILSHILEHVPRPLALLGAVRERLRPGGVLFLETPNRDDLYKRRNDPHVLFFSPESMAEILRKAGFEPRRIESCGERIESILERDRRKYGGSKLARSLRKAVRRARRRLGLAPPPRHRDPARTEADRTGPRRRWIRAVAARPVS